MPSEDQSISVAFAAAVPTDATEASSPSRLPVPRRRLLRALSGVAIGVVAIVGLTSCGGEDGEEDEEDDD